jgi:hypothetical protein
VEWQPIETAPKDGTRFWAYQESDEDKQYVCFWENDFGNWEGWQTNWDNEPEPTHWMPLPAAPSTKGANLAGADRIVKLGTPDESVLGLLKDGEPWVRVGCRDKSLADGKVYWSGKSDRREVMAALTYFETVAGIRNEAGRLSDKEGEA